MDNEVSDELISAIKKKGRKYQIVSAHDHRQNPVESAISTFKNHLTSCLHGAEKFFPAHLWCRTIDQVIIQVNLLRQSRINPRESAYAELYGQFDFNAILLAPIGTEAIIFQPQTNQTTTYSNHGKIAWYLDPCPDKYRNYKCFVTSTKGTR